MGLSIEYGNLAGRPAYGGVSIKLSPVKEYKAIKEVTLLPHLYIIFIGRGCNASKSFMSSAVYSSKLRSCYFIALGKVGCGCLKFYLSTLTDQNIKYEIIRESSWNNRESTASQLISGQSPCKHRLWISRSSQFLERISNEVCECQYGRHKHTHFHLTAD